MAEKIEIVDRPPQAALQVTASIGMLKMPRVMGQTYRRIMEYIEAGSIEPAGAPYCRYTGFDWDALSNEGRLAAFIRIFTRKWDLEMGIPVGDAVKTGDDLQQVMLTGGRHIQTMHRGPYQKVGKTYDRLQQWVREQNLKVRNEAIEIYLNDPRTTAKADLETLILIPLAAE